MKVVCLIQELMNELDLDAPDLARETRVDQRTIDKLRFDTSDWRLSRKALYNLTLFAHSKGFTKGIFEVRPLPFWQSFEGQDVIVHREYRSWDAKGEVQLREFFSKLNSKPLVEALSGDTLAQEKEWLIEKISTQMRNYNCVFIGSPKCSLATEIALSLIWGAEPFDSSPSNVAKVPLHFLGMQPEHRYRASAMIEGGNQTGFRIKLSKTGQSIFVPVDRLPTESYLRSSKEGCDASAVVVCSQPLETSNPVTTIVISGYTGLATSLAIDTLIYGDPSIEVLEVGRPQIAALRFKYKKRPLRQEGTSDGLRKPIEATFKWGPPWENVVTPADAIALEALSKR